MHHAVVRRGDDAVLVARRLLRGDEPGVARIGAGVEDRRADRGGHDERLRVGDVPQRSAQALPELADAGAFDGQRLARRQRCIGTRRGVRRATAQVGDHPPLREAIRAKRGQRSELRRGQRRQDAHRRRAERRSRRAVPGDDAPLRLVHPGLVPEECGLDLGAEDRRGVPQRGEFLADGGTLGIGIDLHLQEVAAPARLDRRLVDDVVARAQHLSRESGARARLALVRNAREDRAEAVLDLERRGREDVGAAGVHRRVPEVVDPDGALVARRQRRVVRIREVRPLQVDADGRRLHRVEGRRLVLDVERARRAERQRRELHVLPPGDVLRRVDVVRRLARPGRHVVLDPWPEVARPVVHPDVGQRVQNGLGAPLERRGPRGARWEGPAARCRDSA